MPIHLEVPIFGPDSAHAAVQAGASRIELNARGSYPAGGLQPSLFDLAQLKDLEIPVRVMIRVPVPLDSSRRKDFMYTPEEWKIMEASIQEFKESGLLNEHRGDGFVFGAVTTNPVEGLVNPLVVDEDLAGRFVSAAKPYKIVFHRAIDEILRWNRSAQRRSLEAWKWTERLDKMGFDGVLTSGGGSTAPESVDLLREMLELPGTGMEIIVGGGVRSSNLAALVDTLGLRREGPEFWVHSSCLTDKESELVDLDELRKMVDILQ